jgi:hypothetical protein
MGDDTYRAAAWINQWRAKRVKFTLVSRIRSSL